MELVDLLEAITYVHCHDEALTEDKFHQVICAKGIASKLVTILSNNSGRHPSPNVSSQSRIFGP